jgi:polygalacturonase
VIQAAIDACSAAGRGIVHFSPGTYQSGAIRLKDNTTLHLEAGTVLTPTHVAEDYPRPGRALVYSDARKTSPSLAAPPSTGRPAISGVRTLSPIPSSPRRLRLRVKPAWN